MPHGVTKDHVDLTLIEPKPENTRAGHMHESHAESLEHSTRQKACVLKKQYNKDKPACAGHMPGIHVETP